jgi:cation transport regulator ChaB
MKHPSPRDIRYAIMDAIFDYHEKQHQRHEAGQIDDLTYARRLFPIHAREIINGAIIKACDEYGEYDA